MPVHKSKTPTKDGRCWFFKVQYEDSFCTTHTQVSKKFATKTEAKDAERQFLTSIKDKKNSPNTMTIGDLWNAFLEYQEPRTRISTRRGYKHTEIYIKPLFNIKCKDFTLPQFTEWLNDLRSKENLNMVSKNDKLKVLRALLNFGTKHYDFNFRKILATDSRMKVPGAIKTEHNIYTLDDFNKFISAEDDFTFQCLWKTLFFCGLRIGEARGLQWKDINWSEHTVWIRKQVQNIDNYSSAWFLCDLKTSTSYRKLPICDSLYNDLKLLHAEAKKFTNYNNDFFLFSDDGGVTPYCYSKARRRKKVISQKAEVKEIRLHDFRHSCASLLINTGTPITSVSKYMGHASITETLNTYSHQYTSDFSNISNLIDKLNE